MPLPATGSDRGSVRPPRPVYIVTGASRGIGSALTGLLLDRGEDVIGVARREPAGVAMSVPHYSHLSLDLGAPIDADALSPLWEWIESARPVVMVLNAGCNVADISENGLDLPAFADILMLNVVNQLRLAGLLQSRLRPASLQVALISSYAAFKGGQANFGYVVSKAIAYELARLQAVMHAPVGVRLQAMVFGAVATDMLKTAPSASKIYSYAVGRWLHRFMTWTPEQAAGALLRHLDSRRAFCFAPGYLAPVAYAMRWAREIRTALLG